MKHHLLFLLFSVVVFTQTIAQPTLTSANSAPKIGDTYTNQAAKATGVSVGSSGANQTWDYSNLQDSTGSSTQTVSNPSATPYPTLFPGANVALTNGTFYTYGTSTANSLYILGIQTGSDTITYTTPKIYMPYPFTDGGSFNSAVALTYSGFSGTISGRDTIDGQGYGTLKLPGGQVFNNVLRVRYIENLATQVLVFTIHLRTVTYNYFVPGFDFPLLSISTSTNDSPFDLSTFNLPIPLSGTQVSYVKNAVLPLNWVSFTSTLQNNQVALKWQTAQEINTNHFNIQRSFNGNDFTDIGKVSATGNSLGSSYSYIDYNVEKLGVTKLYYRLQEIDKDGKAFYSGTNVIELRAVNTTKAYPNPANGYININIKDATVADAVRIYDMKGRLIQQWQNYPVNRLINVKSFTAGSYILQVQVKGKTTSSTIVKE